MIRILNEDKWCAVGKHGRFDYTSLSHSRKHCIRNFVLSCDPQLSGDDDAIKNKWRDWRVKFGWRIVKVKLSIEPKL